MLADLASQHARRVGAGERDPARHRNQQRRNHGDQPVTHGEDGVGPHRFAQIDSLLQRTDQQPGDMIMPGGVKINVLDIQKRMQGGGAMSPAPSR